jgi:hypothetical protein
MGTATDFACQFDIDQFCWRSWTYQVPRCAKQLVQKCPKGNANLSTQHHPAPWVWQLGLPLTSWKLRTAPATSRACCSVAVFLSMSEGPPTPNGSDTRLNWNSIHRF